MHKKGNTNEDLRLQYSGPEPRFSCQFQSSPPQVRGPASLPGRPRSRASLGDHVLQHSHITHTDSFKSSF